MLPSISSFSLSSKNYRISSLFSHMLDGLFELTWVFGEAFLEIVSWPKSKSLTPSDLSEIELESEPEFELWSDTGVGSSQGSFSWDNSNCLAVR